MPSGRGSRTKGAPRQGAAGGLAVGRRAVVVMRALALRGSAGRGRGTARGAGGWTVVVVLMCRQGLSPGQTTWSSVGGFAVMGAIKGVEVSKTERKIVRDAVEASDASHLPSTELARDNYTPGS